MTQALLTLLQLAERERDSAVAALLRAQDAVQALQAQAEQLEQYRAEYRQRHPALGGRSASIELLRCHQGFMQRLDDALAQQQAKVQAAHAHGAVLVAERVAHETRVASVRKLLERRGAEQGRVAARHEQRRSDEAAQQRHAAAPRPFAHSIT